MPDPPPEESYADLALAEADRYLEWERAEGTELNGTDDSIWFLQGILQLMHDLGEDCPLADVKRLAYSVYVARLYERTCRDVRMYVTDDGSAVDGVLVRGPDSVRQFTLNWVSGCIEDPDAVRWRGPQTCFARWRRTRQSPQTPHLPPVGSPLVRRRLKPRLSSS